MATQVFNRAFFKVNGVDLSDHVQSITLNYAAEMLDETAMGDDTRSNKGGLKDWSVDVEFLNDWAAAQVDATLFDLVGSASTIRIQQNSTATVGSTNPQYTGSGVLESYPPLDGSVGDLATSGVTFQSAGTLSRSTST